MHIGEDGTTKPHQHSTVVNSRSSHGHPLIDTTSTTATRGLSKRIETENSCLTCICCLEAINFCDLLEDIAIPFSVKVL
jgi:hypothetical protein